MALIDQVGHKAVTEEMRSQGLVLADAGIDWDLILAPAVGAALKALRREVWEWVDGNPKSVIFKVKVNVKVWFVPVRVNWKVLAKDAEPFVEFILGPRPEPTPA